MNRRRGFTLIELLVVIAIIALLMAILLPSLKKARDQARAIVCQSNLSQWGKMFYLYAHDNDGKFMVQLRHQQLVLRSAARRDQHLGADQLGPAGLAPDRPTAGRGDPPVSRVLALGRRAHHAQRPGPAGRGHPAQHRIRALLPEPPRLYGQRLLPAALLLLPVLHFGVDSFSIGLGFGASGRRPVPGIWDYRSSHLPPASPGQE